MIQSRSAGGVVIGDGGTIVLVRHQDNDAWLFPKGHIDADETDEEAARREVTEETGLTDLEFLDDLGEYSRPRMHPDNSDREDEMKTMRMYLFAAAPHAALVPSMEIGEAKWVPLKDVAQALGNDKDRIWFASVFDRVREAIQRD